MVFNSLTFVVFLSAVLGLYYLPGSWRSKKALLIGASYLFYAAWNPPFVLLLAGSTAVDWHAARRIASAQSPSARRAWLVVSLATNLGLLGFFKYGGFLVENFQALAAVWGIDYQPAQWSIVLPVGISFYTFQTLSYTIDVYRRKLEPWPSAVDFALYVSFFPQLVAGPIVRASEFLPQCREARRPTGDQFGWGWVLLMTGLVEKVVLADWFLAPIAEAVFDAPDQAGFMDGWIGTFAFSGQIFFDFSGYSTCAIGVGLLFGFILPDNFRYPYGSVGFSDFWRRWHLSLSTWLRDYLYIPLGGNRGGAIRVYVNLMVTMLLGGLWHGASWLFVIWGGLHGIYLVLERWMRRHGWMGDWTERAAGQWALVALTYVLVCLTWVFFRSTTFGGALELLGAMTLGGTGELTDSNDRWKVLVFTVLIVAVHRLMRDWDRERTWALLPLWGRSAVLAVGLLLLAFSPGDERAFIYFQF